MFDPASPRLRARLAAGPALGAHWFSLGSPAAVEIAVRAGAEAVIVDLQHGLWDRAGLEAAVGACPPAVPCLVRVEDDSDTALARALDAGAEGVIAPMVESAAQAARLAAACRYPPHGRRSAGGLRPFADFASYRAGSASVVVGVMIETAAGLAEAEAIAAAPGVDLVFVGPTDLGLSLGGEAAAFEAGLARVRAAAAAAGRASGIFTADAADARRRASEGFGLVTPCTDIIALQAAHAAAARWRD